MVDNPTPAVVAPAIPASDVTPLERLILALALDESKGPDGLSFSSWEGLSDIVSTDPDDLRSSLAASRDRDSRINAVVVKALTRHDAIGPDDRDSCVDIDLRDGPVGIVEILQDVVRRSSTLREIVLHTSSNAFKGSVTRITGDAIQHYTTDEVLAQMRKDIPT